MGSESEIIPKDNVHALITELRELIALAHNSAVRSVNTLLRRRNETLMGHTWFWNMNALWQSELVSSGTGGEARHKSVERYLEVLGYGE